MTHIRDTPGNQGRQVSRHGTSYIYLSNISSRALKAHAKQLETQVLTLKCKIKEMRRKIGQLEDELANARAIETINLCPSSPPIPHTSWDVEGVANTIDSFSIHSDEVGMPCRLAAPEVCYPMWYLISATIPPDTVGYRICVDTTTSGIWDLLLLPPHRFMDEWVMKRFGQTLYPSRRYPMRCLDRCSPRSSHTHNIFLSMKRS